MNGRTGNPGGAIVEEPGAGAGKAGGTALARYQRLESTGLWRPSPEAQRREVALRLGQATLTLIDPRSGAALGHWSLPAVRRLPGKGEGATFAPGREGGETLALTDPDMIEALDALESAVRSAAPRPGRLRGFLIGAGLVVLAGAALSALPAALASYAAGEVPASRRAEIGQRILEDIEAGAGPSCSDRQGLAALARLAERLFGPADTPIIHVLRAGPARPLHLPGGLILLPASLLDESSPQALAGAALVENLAARDNDPLRGVLDWAGLRATLSLLISGELSPTALDGYGSALLGRRAPALPAPGRLAAAFGEAGVAPAPYAEWRARHGNDGAGDGSDDGDASPAPATASATAPASVAAAAPGAAAADTSLMPDNDWVALQSVCGR